MPECMKLNEFFSPILELKMLNLIILTYCVFVMFPNSSISISYHFFLSDSNIIIRYIFRNLTLCFSKLMSTLQLLYVTKWSIKIKATQAMNWVKERLGFVSLNCIWGPFIFKLLLLQILSLRLHVCVCLCAPVRVFVCVCEEKRKSYHNIMQSNPAQKKCADLKKQQHSESHFNPDHDACTNVRIYIQSFQCSSLNINNNKTRDKEIKKTNKESFEAELLKIS